MAVQDLTFTIKDLDDDVKLGTAKELGFIEDGEQTLDEFYAGFFLHEMLARTVKPAMIAYLTKTEDEALRAQEELARAAAEATVVEIA